MLAPVFLFCFVGVVGDPINMLWHKDRKKVESKTNWASFQPAKILTYLWLDRLGMYINFTTGTYLVAGIHGLGTAASGTPILGSLVSPKPSQWVRNASSSRKIQVQVPEHWQTHAMWAKTKLNSENSSARNPERNHKRFILLLSRKPFLVGNKFLLHQIKRKPN